MPDGGRRRGRADRPPDVPAAVARRGGAPEFRDGSAALRAAALGPRLHPHRLLRDRRRRVPGARRGPPDDRLLLDRPHLQAALGDARLRRCRRGGGRRVPQGRPGRRPGADPGRDGGRVHRGRDRWTRSAPASRRRPSAATASCSTPPTYFIPPEQIGEYQAKIIEAFGPAFTRPESGRAGARLHRLRAGRRRTPQLARVPQRRRRGRSRRAPARARRACAPTRGSRRGRE